jgi:hypothetical protein
METPSLTATLKGLGTQPTRVEIVVEGRELDLDAGR